MSKWDGLTLRWIAKKINVHENSVKIVLKKLKIEGIVYSTPTKVAKKKKIVEKYFLTNSARKILMRDFFILFSSYEFQNRP
ncbi:MAG: hypothetical protein P1P85_02425 [Patescibacteria group bacterium]|nr:hypothetical protein [Patescibacteria group bacterium]